ncbi:MAG: hypothetical protein ABEI78_01370 [Candidatus Nanohaloarchaea archaeon]
MKEDTTEIGQIIRSKSHIDYTCEIYNKAVKEEPPEPTDYEFGQFVFIEKTIRGEKKAFVGIIYDTQIVDPDEGRSGPRLSTPQEQNVFQPSYVDEKQVLAGIALLGTITIEDGEIIEKNHSIPQWTLQIDDQVKKMDEEDVIKFHELEDQLKLEYYQRINQVAGGFATDILTEIIGKLKENKPEEAEPLEVIKQNLEWQKQMGEN